MLLGGLDFYLCRLYDYLFTFFIIFFIDWLQRDGIDFDHRCVLYVKNTGKPLEYYFDLIVKAKTCRKDEDSELKIDNYIQSRKYLRKRQISLSIMSNHKHHQSSTKANRVANGSL